MLNNHSLLELYVLEKADLNDPLFGSPFPSFKRWKLNVQHESIGCYKTAIKMENAVNEADELIANQEVSTKPVSVVKLKPKTSKESDMAAKGKSKVEKAQAVFDKYFGTLPRKDIIAKFTGTRVGLTDNGASTYYQKMKTAAAA